MLLPFEIMAVDIQLLESVGICRCLYIEKRRIKKDFISWSGEKFFPDLPEKKRQRIAVQIIVGISLAFVCMVGMGIFRYKAVKQLEKYQAIADTYAQLDTILEEEREKSQKEAATELWDFRIRNHADMESYNAWMEELQGRALYYEEPDHAPASIITLATCDRRVHGKNGRFLVIAEKPSNRKEKQLPRIVSKRPLFGLFAEYI